MYSDRDYARVRYNKKRSTAAAVLLVRGDSARALGMYYPCKSVAGIIAAAAAAERHEDGNYVAVAAAATARIAAAVAQPAAAHK